MKNLNQQKHQKKSFKAKDTFNDGDGSHLYSYGDSNYLNDYPQYKK